MSLLTGRGVKEPPKVPGSAPAPPNLGDPVRTDSAPWLEIRQSLEGLRTGFSDMARFLQRIEQRMLNQDFDEQTVRVPGGAEGKAYKLPEGTAGIIVSAPSGSSLSTITIRHGLHVYTPNANSNPVFIPTTRTVREVVFYSSGSAGTIIPVNVTALGYAAAQMWASVNGTGQVSLTGSTVGQPAGSSPQMVGGKDNSGNAQMLAMLGGGGAFNPAAFLGVVVNAMLAANSSNNPGNEQPLVEINGTGVLSTPGSGTKPVYITTATTTAVKASRGVLGSLSNASGAVTGAITVYDNTAASGNVLWQGTLAAGQVLPIGMPCATGITIVTAAADAIAVSYA